MEVRRRPIRVLGESGSRKNETRAVKEPPVIQEEMEFGGLATPTKERETPPRVTLWQERVPNGQKLLHANSPKTERAQSCAHHLHKSYPGTSRNADRADHFISTREEMGIAARGAAIPKVGHNTEGQASLGSLIAFTPE